VKTKKRKEEEREHEIQFDDGDFRDRSSLFFDISSMKERATNILLNTVGSSVYSLCPPIHRARQEKERKKTERKGDKTKGGGLRGQRGSASIPQLSLSPSTGTARKRELAKFRG
jgi:hypothetical protein